MQMQFPESIRAMNKAKKGDKGMPKLPRWLVNKSITNVLKKTNATSSFSSSLPSQALHYSAKTLAN
jgi:hypothetical protein